MIYVFIAQGFEEIEAVSVVDILRRSSGLRVMTVGVGGKEIVGAHGIKITADITEDEVNVENMEMVVLPGGLPGADNLENSQYVRDYIGFCNVTQKYIAAICAAPQILGHLKLLEGKTVTCYPGFEKELGENVIYTGKQVEIDGNIITAKGPGAATEFALKLIEVLGDSDKANNVKDGLMVE